MRQRGYAFLVILIALAIVAWLARDSLGALLGNAARGPDLSSRLPAAAQPAADPTGAQPTPAAPVERARAVEDLVRQQSEARMRQGEAASK